MAQPSRAYDALYDPSFTVAGPRDHYRQQTLAGGFNIERAPVYNNFFSELPHHPPSTLRLKNADRVPAFVDRNFHGTSHAPAELSAKSDPLAVSGPNRPKYFRRPMLAAAEIHVRQALPPLGQPQDLNATAPAALQHNEPRSKTIGTQSDYRENEVQTAPWEPGFVLPPNPTAKQQALSKRFNCDGPEVLQLRDMQFPDGLPAGLQEVTRIDKMRAKRAFEATLPPIDDIARLPLRQKMIEAWEAKEWEEREQEILSIQDERLVLLDNALQVREEEIDEDNRARVEARKAAMMTERASKFADVQATRIKTMRQLIENRKYVEQHRRLHKPSVVERYANFGSSAYAPVAREGRFPETKPRGKELETEGYSPATLQGVMELESFLPSRLLSPKVAVPQKPGRLNYQQRKEAAVQRDLATINTLLDTAKGTAGRGFGDCWPAPLGDDAGGASAGGGAGGTGRHGLSSAGGAGPVLAHLGSSIGGSPGRQHSRHLQGSVSTGGGSPGGGVSASPSRKVVRAVERPPTPTLPPPPAVSTPAAQVAVVLLQRLLRGRAAQNVWYEGRMRRQELIDELRLDERIRGQDGEGWLDGRPIRRPEDRDAASLRVDGLVGSAVAEVAAILSERDAARREVLLAGLDVSTAHATAAAVAAAAADISRQADEETEERAAAAAAEAAAAADATAAAGGGDDGGGSSAAAAETAYAEVVAAAAAPQRTAALNLEALGITAQQAEEAAVRIQAAARGHRARREVAAMRARGEALRMVMANGGSEAQVVVCQAAIRGYLDRKKVAKLRQSMRERGASPEAAKPPSAAAEPEETVAEPHVFDQSSYSDEHVAAVTRIQAVQRGRIARRRVAGLRGAEAGGGADGAEAEAGAGAEAEASGVFGDMEYTAEQQAAVIRIQAAGRGYLARREVNVLRQRREQEEQQGQEGVGVEAGEAEQGDAVAEQGGVEEGGPAAAAGGEATDEGEGEAVWPHVEEVAGVVRAHLREQLAAQLREGEGEGAEGGAQAGAGDGEEGEREMAEPSLSGGAYGEAEEGQGEGGQAEASAALLGEPSLAVGDEGDAGADAGPEEGQGMEEGQGEEQGKEQGQGEDQEERQDAGEEQGEGEEAPPAEGEASAGFAGGGAEEGDADPEASAGDVQGEEEGGNREDVEEGEEGGGGDGQGGEGEGQQAEEAGGEASAWEEGQGEGGPEGEGDGVGAEGEGEEQ